MLALTLFSTAGLGGLAVFRRRDWRFAAWMTGFVALYLVEPRADRGVLMAARAIGFVATTEHVRGGLLNEAGAIEKSAVR